MQSEKYQKTFSFYVRTNKGINLIVAIQPQKTVRQLANRILSSYVQIEQQNLTQCIPKIRELTVASIKFQNFFIPKEEIIAGILHHNDFIECYIVKAKPKIPKEPKAYYHTLKQMNQFNTLNYVHPQKVENHWIQQVPESISQRKQSKINKKKKKLKLKQRQKRKNQQNIHAIQKVNNKLQLPKMPILKQKQQQIKQNWEKIKKAEIINKQYSKQQQQREEQMIQQAIKSPTFNFQNKIQEEKHQQKKLFVTESQVLPDKKQSTLDNKKIKQTEIQNSCQLNSALIIKNLQIKGSQQKITKQQKNQKKNKHGKINSILSMLYEKVGEDKKKKNKKQEKQKLKSKVNPINQNNSKNPLLQQQYKNASPKVTFHNSPQLCELTSPKRKLSNPIVQIDKFELEQNNKGMEQQKSSPNFGQIKKDHQQVSTSSPKIIEEESESDKDQMKNQTKVEKQQKIGKDKKLDELNIRLNKYSAKLFSLSDDDEQ